MAKHETPMLDQLESGPWPSFVSDLKEQAERRAKNEDGVEFQIPSDVCEDLLGETERGGVGNTFPFTRHLAAVAVIRLTGLKRSARGAVGKRVKTGLRIRHVRQQNAGTAAATGNHTREERS